MTDSRPACAADDKFSKTGFAIRTLEDEIRADERCTELLGLFTRHLSEAEGFSLEEAGILARGTDYFVRDFLVADRRCNILDPGFGRVRQFAGNWYIIKNLDPSAAELSEILSGIRAFYAWCRELGKISAELFEDIRGDCEKIAYYQQRIEDFWALEGNDYPAWDRACKPEP